MGEVRITIETESEEGAMGLFDWLSQGDTGSASGGSPTPVEKRMPLFSAGILVEMSDEEVIASFANLNANFSRTVEDSAPVIGEMARRGITFPDKSGLLTAASKFSAHNKSEDGDADGDAEGDGDGVDHEGGDGSGDPVVKTGDVPFCIGPDEAPVAFFGAGIGRIDSIRKGHYQGPAGETLREIYLSVLDFGRDDVLLGNIVPVLLKDDRDKIREPNEEEVAEWLGHFWKAVDAKRPRTIIALGKTARTALGDDADMWLPHPVAVRILGDTGEVGRKLGNLRAKLKKMIRERSESEYRPRWTPPAPDPVEKIIKCEIIQKDDEKQLITGVVLEPEKVDSQGDVISSEEIEKASHFWFTNSQIIGDEHSDIADDVQPVESYLAPDDLTFDGGSVKKGTWLVTVHVKSSDRWAQVKDGEYNGFSVGAFGTRSPAEVSA